MAIVIAIQINLIFTAFIFAIEMNLATRYEIYTNYTEWSEAKI